MTTKSIQDYLEEMQKAGHSLTEIVQAIDTSLDNTRNFLTGMAAQYLGAARNNTQLAAMYLERYEADSGSCVPIVYKLTERKE
jgi:predicted transcriptional regulator with HTH domain